MFRITSGKGFQMKFGNGNTVSVQFGYGNYCENRDKFPEAGRMRDWQGDPEEVSSSTAEIAAWSADGTWYEFGYDQVEGYVSADRVASFIEFVQSSDVSKDRWENPE